MHKHGHVLNIIHAHVLPKQHSSLHKRVDECVYLSIIFFHNINGQRTIWLITRMCDQPCNLLEVQEILPILVHGHVKGV